jgi:hypothetical protein
MCRGVSSSSAASAPHRQRQCQCQCQQRPTIPLLRLRWSLAPQIPRKIADPRSPTLRKTIFQLCLVSLCCVVCVSFSCTVSRDSLCASCVCVCVCVCLGVSISVGVSRVSVRPSRRHPSPPPPPPPPPPLPRPHRLRLSFPISRSLSLGPFRGGLAPLARLPLPRRTSAVNFFFFSFVVVVVVAAAPAVGRRVCRFFSFYLATHTHTRDADCACGATATASSVPRRPVRSPLRLIQKLVTMAAGPCVVSVLCGTVSCAYK